MMKFKIIKYEQTPKATDEINIDEDRKLLEKFYSFARRQHNCVGLAANQVSCDGERIRKPFFSIKHNKFWDIVINPKILEYHGKKVPKIETCLTWLGCEIHANRSPEIKVSYMNLKREEIKETISGFKAQIWQHEYDHLMGIEDTVFYSNKI